MAALLSTNMMAQPAANNQDKKQQRPTPEQMLEHQTKAMQQRLLLDEQKGAEFASLYKEYKKALQDCRPAPKQGKQKELTDAEIEQCIEASFTTEKKIIETKESYYKKFKKILNARQLNVIFGPKNKAPRQGQNNRPDKNNHPFPGNPGQPQMPQQPNK